MTSVYSLLGDLMEAVAARWQLDNDWLLSFVIVLVKWEGGMEL